MNVKLISITPNCEEIIMYCARVSNPINQDSGNVNLLKYCINNNHWSIFEQGYMTLEIETSRAISTQIIRHKTFNFQEFSQRYAEVQNCEIYEARRQDNKNRQNSIDDLSPETKQWFIDAQKEYIELGQKLYKEALNKDIAKEQARFLLPMSSSTKLYMTSSIRSWIHYIDVRTDNSTQLEHRVIAGEAKKIFCDQLPNISKSKGWII